MRLLEDGDLLAKTGRAGLLAGDRLRGDGPHVHGGLLRRRDWQAETLDVNSRLRQPTSQFAFSSTPSE